MLEAEKGERETKQVIIQYHLMDRSVGAQMMRKGTGNYQITQLQIS